MLLLPPFPGLFYDVCQRQHRLQKVFRAGPKLSEVQQPSGKRSGHCGWSGRRMVSPSISHLPVPTSNLSVSPVRRSVLLVRCLLLVFGFPRPALPQGVSRTAAFEWRSLHIQYIYIHIYVCIYIHVCSPAPSVTSRSSSYRNFCASKNNNRLVLRSHSGGAPAPRSPFSCNFHKSWQLKESTFCIASSPQWQRGNGCGNEHGK